MRGRAGLLSVILSWVAIGFALAETPQKVTPCALRVDPATYDHELIEVTGFVSHGFEDFSLFDPDCVPRFGVWLEYGGTMGSKTISCCNGTPALRAGEPLVLEGLTIPLVDDRSFQTLQDLLEKNDGILVHATLVGRFFAGHGGGISQGVGGYGHFGCCSLLAIQQVKAVDPVDRPDIDYDPEPDQPEIEGVGCWFRDLAYTPGMSGWIDAQREADKGQPWAFQDPKRVAAAALSAYAGEAAGSAVRLEETHRTKTRIFYASKSPLKGVSYMAVVSRPYIATFYARDPKRIAWIAIALYESSCEPRE